MKLHLKLELKQKEEAVIDYVKKRRCLRKGEIADDHRIQVGRDEPRRRIVRLRGRRINAMSRSQDERRIGRWIVVKAV